MRLTCSAAFWALFASTATAPVQAKGLRRKLIAKNDCTIMAVEPLALEGGEEPDMILECELSAEDAGGVSGISAPILATAAQLKELKDLITSGELAAGEDILDIEGDEIDENHQIKIEPTVSMQAKAAKAKTAKADKRRRLVDTTGDLKMLLVKVTDSGGLTYPDSPATMSDEVFGTGVDPINLKSGLEECSWDKLTVLPKALTSGGSPDNTHEVATGVVEVTIDISLTDQGNSAIRNAITTKVQNMLGYGLPGPYDYVLYSVEKCYVDCGWAAYAYINSWNSVYQGVYYKRPGVLMHEIGHNFGLAHSGGLNGATYTDHTCTMGNPHYSDDAFQCFNPAKNFQLNWYDDAEITEDPRTQGYTNTLTLVGIDEYPDRGDSPVTVRLETGGGADYFVGFNRASATGPNRMNDEGDNQVTIVQVNGNSGESYSQSFLKAKLSQGQSYAITNYAGTGKTVTITATSIDISTTPGTAVVYISDGLVPAPPSPPPTPAPVTPACEGSDPDTCGCDVVKQNDYRGDISTTEDGYTCMNWESQSPHSHDRTAANYPDKGLGNHSYCRNPDGEPRAWCYTTDPNKRWSLCDVPSCTPPTTTTTTTTTSTTTTTTGTTVASTTTSTQLPTCNTPELTDLDVLDLRTVLKDANSNCETALSKKKVLMIGIDGLRADVVGMTPLPHIARLKNMGTHSFWADVQSTASAVSGPGWASMFTGVEPSKHKVDGNGDLTDLASPTVFKAVKDAFDMKIAASVSWHPLVNDFIDNEDNTTLDDSFLASNDNTMAAKAKDWILSEAYDFVFVDFDGADAAGHSLGFDGYLESYQNRVVEIDALVGTLLDAVMETSAGEEWLIVLTSDHGGEGTSHSAYDKYNRKIPFIVASNSPRVDVGFMPLADPGSQMDVLPTIMYFLGGESAIPDGLDGQVFGFKEYTRAPPPPPPGACIPDANNCGCASEKQADYRGNIAVTASGKTCQAWSSQSPHSHSRTSENYPNSGLDANYCRNPDGEPSAWCYTTDSGTRFELCEVPTCDTA